MHMSKSIRLSEDAYERLAAHKREEETFSDVVLRVAGERSLLELADILDDEDTDAMRTAVEERRERRSDDLEAVADGAREAFHEGVVSAGETTTEEDTDDVLYR